MATDNLDRIAALMDRLSPLAGKTRGMRIEADDWNSLVETVQGTLQVERAQDQSTQAQIEDRFALKEHDHLGQVTVAWLDADLQARIGSGDSSIATRAALADMDGKITSFGTELGRLSDISATQGRLLDQSQVDELDRSRKLKQFDDRFAGVENLRTLVSGLSNDVNAVKTNVNTVLQLRQSLRDPAGNPLDVAKMRDDITGLQALTENFKGVDGNPLRLRDIEIKLGQVSDAVGTGAAGGLDVRIGNAVAAAEGRLTTKVDERAAGLKDSFNADITASENRLRGELTASTDASRATLGQSLNDQIGAAEGRINTQVDTKIAQSAADSNERILAAATSAMDARLAQIPDQVRAVATSVVNDLRSGLRDELTTNLTGSFDAQFKALDTKVSTRMDATDARVSDVQASIPSVVGGQLDAFGRDFETRLNANLDTRIAKASDTLKQDLITIIKGSVADGIGNLDARIASGLDARLATLDDRIGRAVTAATRNLSQDIAAEVGRQIASADIAGQLQTANDALAQQLRAEQTQALADLQARSSTAISNATTTLRGEISALRNETTSTIDSRLNTFKGTLKPDTFKALSPVIPVSPIVHP